MSFRHQAAKYASYAIGGALAAPAVAVGLSAVALGYAAKGAGKAVEAVGSLGAWGVTGVGKIGSGIGNLAPGLKTAAKQSVARYTGDHTINNLYTGYKPGFVGSGMILGGLTLASVGNMSENANQIYEEQAKNNGGDFGVQSLPQTRGDLAGYNRMVPTNTMDLGATGDLVFALHKLRGGY